MPLNVRVVSGPIAEPITVQQAKAQARIDAGSTLDDPLFAIYVPAAREYAEEYTNRAFFNQIWIRTLDSFPLATGYDSTIGPADRQAWAVAGQIWNLVAIDLPGGRVVQVISITYVDENGVTQTLDPSTYRVDLSSEPCRLTPAPAVAVWPFSGVFQPGSIAIEYEVASYVQQVVEQFTVPAAAPYQYMLEQADDLTGIQSVADANGNPVAGWTNNEGALTFPAGDAGQVYTVEYSVANCPFKLQLALLQLAAHFYRNPEAASDLKLAEVPISATKLLDQHLLVWEGYRPC